MTEVQVPLVDEEASWRRLHVRMLLIHPIRELLRSWYVLVGLIFVGSRSVADGRLWGLLGVVMVIGLAWLVVNYIAGQQIPFMSGLGNWNFAIGFALMIGGLLMTMRWR